MTVFESDLVRKMDEAAIASGVPSFELMDRAAFGLFHVRAGCLEQYPERRSLFFLALETTAVTVWHLL